MCTPGESQDGWRPSYSGESNNSPDTERKHPIKGPIHGPLHVPVPQGIDERVQHGGVNSALHLGHQIHPSG